MPERVLSHGHWLKDGKKMSKSLGNVICPFDLIAEFGPNSLRTYFLAEGPQTDDVNFQRPKLLDTHNFFLVNSFVNLFARVVGKKVQSRMPVQLGFSGSPDYDATIAEVESLAVETCKHMDALNFADAVGCVKQIVFAGNNLLGLH